MANFSALETAIAAYVKQNGNNAITGNGLQDILLAMVDTIGNEALNDLVADLDAEELARQNADGTLQDNIDAETTARAGADNALGNRITAIEGKIPSAATLSNQLADKAFVNAYVQALNDAVSAIQGKMPTEASDENQLADKAFVNALIAAITEKIPSAASALNKLADREWVTSLTTVLQNTINALKDDVKNGYVYAGIAKPWSAPASGKVFYIATIRGQYTNFGNIEVPDGINILRRIGNNWVSDFVFNSDALRREIEDFKAQVRDWMCSYAPIVINGDVTNAPDEVDLTAAPDNLLKFKNKAYNPAVWSGLGKKYLRKNIIPEVESVSFDGFVENVPTMETLSGTPDAVFFDRVNEVFVGLKDNVYYLAWTDDDDFVPVTTTLVYMYDGTPYRWNGTDLEVDEDVVPTLNNIITQAMISDENTIYVIRYDYDLNGETITMPEDCVLKFEGGSLSNGTIVGNFTKIDASLTTIFGNNLTTNGSWNIPEAYPEWFGAKTYGNVDCADAIEKAMQLVFYDAGVYPIHSVPVVLSGMYVVSRTITLKPFTILKGQNPRYTGLMALDDFDGDFLFQTQEHTTFPNSRQGFECIGFDCNGQTSGVCLYGANELFICRNVQISKYSIYGMYLTALIRDDEPGRTTPTQNCLFEDLFISSPVGIETYGLYLERCTDCVFIRTTIDSDNNSLIGTLYGIYGGTACNANTFIKLNTEDCKHPIYLSNRNCYNFNIQDYLCKNPAIDLEPYGDDVIAVIRTVSSRNLTVSNYKMYANDVDKDIHDTDVDENDKYKRYDLYTTGSYGKIILPVTISTNIKAASFSVSASVYNNGEDTIYYGLSTIDLGRNAIIYTKNFIWDKDYNLDAYDGLEVGVPLSIRQDVEQVVGTGQIAVANLGADIERQFVYNSGERSYKIKGTPVGYELGGLSSDKPSSSVRYEYEQYYDIQVDKLLNIVDGRWVDALGFSGVIKNGSTTQRNNLISNNKFVPEDAGCMFFDKTLGKPVFLKVTDNGSSADPRYTYSWVDATGQTV